MKQIITLFVLILSFSCSKDNDDVKILNLTIASEMKINPEPPYQDFLYMPEQYWVKFPNDKNWSLLCPKIKGFEYEEGYEYVIKVEQKEVEKDLMDTPFNHYYTLLEVVFKVKKQSEGLD